MNGSVNLMPQDYRRSLGEHNVRGKWLAFLGVGLAGVLVSWGVMQSHIRQEQHALDAVVQRIDILRTQAEHVRATAADAARKQAEVERYREIALPIEMTEIVGCVSALLPESVVLTELRLHLVVQPVSRSALESGNASRVAASSKRPGDAAVEMRRVVQGECSGLATSDVQVAEFLGQLDAHDLFHRPQMDYSRTIDQRGVPVREFRITFQIETNAIYERHFYPVHLSEPAEIGPPTDFSNPDGGEA